MSLESPDSSGEVGTFYTGDLASKPVVRYFNPLVIR